MDFIVDLKHKIDHCEYDEAAISVLCERIVQGSRNEHVYPRLLGRPDDELTMDNAIKINRASELTSEQVRALGETEVKHTQIFNRCCWHHEHSKIVE